MSGAIAAGADPAECVSVAFQAVFERANASTSHSLKAIDKNLDSLKAIVVDVAARCALITSASTYWRNSRAAFEIVLAKLISVQLVGAEDCVLWAAAQASGYVAELQLR